MSWQPKTLGQFLLEKDLSSEALVTQEERFTFRELKEKAEQAAGAMQALGIGKGDHVAILMPNGGQWLALFYGAALIGAVTVPVNTRFKAAEIDFCLKKSGARALFYVDRFLNIDYGAMVREIGFDRAFEVSRMGKGNYAPVEVQPDDQLLIQFTSGTTAYPKGVMLTHDNMLRNAWAAGTRIGVRPEDRYFNCRPFFHVGGSTLSALMSLVFGCCLVTLPTFRARAALEMLERERCTLISGNDTIFQMLMGHEDFPRRRLSLRGGWAAAGPQTMRAIIDRLGMKAVCAAYGLSEASPNVVMSDWRDPEELRVQGLALPLPGIEIRISDENEIQVRGWSIMRGYCNDLDATARAFTADGWLRTGDLGELTADGRLRMVGRLKDVFRVGGENVAPAEVEEVLLGHPAIETAQVIGVPDARLGEVPCAYVTLKSGHCVSEEEIVSFVKSKAANFRVPRYLKIVPDFESLGMTASGKVQKTKLRERALKDFGL
ncbi:MAG: fatty-acid--CoA ligase [Betaproteobacteria bacterium]|nr:fatty-acid--CoA ligase [Betaproteobacteria bacterium]